MSTWNFRVIEFVDPNGEPWRSIHEVHYDAAGNPTGYSEGPAGVTWDVDEGDDSASWTLAQMALALRRPVLVERDFESTQPEPPQ